MPVHSRAQKRPHLRSAADRPVFLRQVRPIRHRFADDGETPNHPRYPLLHYRGALDFPDELEPAAVIEVLFAANGWRRSWRNGVYDFLHFHTRTHEVLGIARGRARVQFGGAKGRVLALRAGDVVAIPAGTGHVRQEVSRNLLVVGAYPENGGAYDEPKPEAVSGKKVRALIPRVPRPPRDPVYGRDGPLCTLWRS
jgi:uncharacterized protein YjlB